MTRGTIQLTDWLQLPDRHPAISLDQTTLFLTGGLSGLDELCPLGNDSLVDVYDLGVEYIILVISAGKYSFTRMTDLLHRQLEQRGSCLEGDIESIGMSLRLLHQ